MPVFSGRLGEVSEPVLLSGPDLPASSDVSETETACDSSAADGSCSSDPENQLGEPGLDSLPNLYMLASDSRQSESNSNVTLAVDNAFERLEKAYRALRQAV